MGILPFLPTVKRCCFCTRKLKVACVFIVMWSMLITSHEIGILCWPVCHNLYEHSQDPAHSPFIILRWILFAVNILILASSFAYLIGIFWSFPITATVFICCGIVSALCSITFAILYAVEMASTKCTNPSDVFAFSIYAVVWCYFIIVVNSYDMK